MKTAIVGFDREGHATYDYLRRLGDDITICDLKTDIELPDGVASQLGEDYLHGLDQFDRIVRTAGMPRHILLDANPAIDAKITTHINLFFEACPTKQIIGITGTKGKGTTSTLVAKLLEAAGKPVRLGGNIGIPPLTFLSDLTPDSWVVLELSSFQLSDIAYSPHIGVCLMVVPEHLNWHADMAEYKHAKSNLFARQTSSDIAIYFNDNADSRAIAAAGNGQKLPFYTPPGAWVKNNMIVINDTEVCSVDELKLLGRHNWQNACAAVTAYWQVSQDATAARSVLSSFSGLPHRLELVKVVDSVKYFNDSFAATPDAAVAAMQAVEEPKIMILGGFDRGLPIEHLARALAETDSVRHALLIGASADRLAAACRAAGFDRFQVSQAAAMAQIVSEARMLAMAGDAVVLSPGFASFDLFKNFEERGDQFRASVAAL